MLQEELRLPGDSGAGGRLELQHHSEQGRVNVPTSLSKRFVKGLGRLAVGGQYPTSYNPCKAEVLTNPVDSVGPQGVHV